MMTENERYMLRDSTYCSAGVFAFKSFNTGHRNGRSYSRAPPKNIIRPSSLLELALCSVVADAVSRGQREHHAARLWQIPSCLLLCESAKANPDNRVSSSQPSMSTRTEYLPLRKRRKIPAEHDGTAHHLLQMWWACVLFHLKVLFARSGCPAQLPTPLHVCERGGKRLPPNAESCAAQLPHISPWAKSGPVPGLVCGSAR